MLRRVMLGTIVFAMACGGGGGGGGGGAADAPSGGKDGSGGGSANTVMTVDCAGVTPIATVTTPNDGLMYSSNPAGSAGANSSDIQVGDVISFQPGATHPVGPDAPAGMTDNGLVAPQSATTCLKFTAVGDFHYKCTEHGFKGTVNVTQ